MIETLHLYNGVSMSYANLSLSAAGNRSAVGLGPIGDGKEKSQALPGFFALLAVTAAVLRKKGAAAAPA